MSNQPAPDEFLNPLCDAALKSWDCYATQNDDSATAAIRDADGVRLFNVTVGISVFDLQEIFRYGRRVQAAASRQGAEELARQFRALLGVDAKERLNA